MTTHGEECLVPVDGKYFLISDQVQEFYSHNLKKSGLWYEVAICLNNGYIVSVNGPY